ncbi:MAG: 6-phosphofructokinase [Armatimonadetes bacterium]|nr:6-phosphofructokinase [Armatimonadota bacterium]
MGLKGNALIGQSGGPTIVINASVAGAVAAARDVPEIEAFYGALNGVAGALQEQMIDLFREDPALLEEIAKTPSAALGTCRLKPTDEDLERLLEVFKAHNIRYFFYIGGNDSQLACHRIAELAANSDWEMQVVGIPKTIDNDLLITDNCPGFGSAARFAASAVQFVGKDAEAFGNIEVVEIMGRNAGWITGATQVGRREEKDPPHCVYVPEFKVDPEDFLEDTKAAFEEYGFLVVAVSEGFAFSEAELATVGEKVDEFGHARLGGVAQALADMLEEEIGVRARFDRLGNLQRCMAFCRSKVDFQEAYAVGEEAVRRAVAGETGIMITIQRKQDDPFEFECETTSLESVADKVKLVPREWINDRGNGITEEFVNYALPLMQGEDEPLPANIPAYPRLQKYPIEGKLPPYERKK